MPQPTIRHAPYLILLCALLALAACRREAATARVEPSRNRVTPPAPKPPAANPRAKRVVGSWVSRPGPPEGGPHDICDTDMNFDFGADGSFATSTDEGRWSGRGNRLVITIIIAAS